jgi:hypothetical protein
LRLAGAAALLAVAGKIRQIREEVKATDLSVCLAG